MRKEEECPIYLYPFKILFVLHHQQCHIQSNFSYLSDTWFELQQILFTIVMIKQSFVSLNFPKWMNWVKFAENIHALKEIDTSDLKDLFKV